MDLGDDGRGGNGDGKRVAVDDRVLRQFAMQAHGVDQEMIGARLQLPHSILHGDARRLVDVDLVDAGGIDFGDGLQKAITIPWGDVATAFHTTGIPNFEVYIAVPMALRVGLRLARWSGPLLASAPVQRLLKARVARGPSGPTAAVRAAAEARLWAEARDDAGVVARARLRTAESYELTSWTAVELAARTHELSDFLVNVLKTDDVGARFEGSVTDRGPSPARGSRGSSS